MPLVLDGNGDITGLVTGALEAAAIGTGAVRQVVQAITTTRTVATTTTYTDLTGLTASITPLSSSSRILVMVNYSLGTGSGTGSESPIGINLIRGSTQIAEYSRAIDLRAGTASNESNVYITGGFVYLDSPSSTSSVTYKCQAKQSIGSFGRSFDVSPGSSPSTMTLLEIA
jgi:hypothetical protein